MLHPVGLYTARGTTDPTVDLSDGFVKAFDGDVPDDYYRAQDQPTASDPLVARIGTNGSSASWPTYSATGISGNPSLNFSSGNYLSLSHLSARQAADPNAPFGIAMPIRRTASAVGYIFAFGDPTTNNRRFGFYLSTTGNVGFQTVTSGGVLKDNILGASAIPLNTDAILAITYRGTSGLEVRTLIGSTETVRLFAASAETLLSADFAFTDCRLGNTPILSPDPFPGRIGGAVIKLAAWDSGELTTAMAHYKTLYPV